MKIFTSFGYLSLSGVELQWYSSCITGVFWTYWYFLFKKRKEKRQGMYLRGIWYDTYRIHEYEQKWNIRAKVCLNNQEVSPLKHSFDQCKQAEV